MTTYTRSTIPFKVKNSVGGVDDIRVSTDGTFVIGDSILTSLANDAAITPTSIEGYLTVQTSTGATFYVALYKNIA